MSTQQSPGNPFEDSAQESGSQADAMLAVAYELRTANLILREAMVRHEHTSDTARDEIDARLYPREEAS